LLLPITVLLVIAARFFFTGGSIDPVVKAGRQIDDKGPRMDAKGRE
jgi:hypothetical protein